jgi:hypothetical protein
MADIFAIKDAVKKAGPIVIERNVLAPRQAQTLKPFYFCTVTQSNEIFTSSPVVMRPRAIFGAGGVIL